MPHDFRNKSFQKVLRGYAPDEVDEYISYLNEEYRKLERRTADSERKLALALKKLEESVKNGSADSVGPAAREAAAKLLRETEVKREEILAAAEKQAGETAERIVRDAEEQAQTAVQGAVQQAEAILAEARAEAEAHRDDVRKAQAAARSIYEEIGSFREKLFGLYNDHLDAVEGITDAAQSFMDDVDAQCPPAEDGEGDAEPAEEIPGEDPAEPDEPEEETEEVPEDETEEELPVSEAAAGEASETGEADAPADEPAEEPQPVLDEEAASNLAFMDRLFDELRVPAEEAAVPSAGNTAGGDLYIEIPEEEDDGDDGYPEEDFVPEEFPDDTGTDCGEDEGEDGLPAITIDWKNRSAISSDEPEGEVTVDESQDFRTVEGFDDDFADYGEEEYEEENYDEYGAEYVEDYGDAASGEEPEDESEDEDEDPQEEPDEYHDMDEIFNEDPEKREMSLTDEFNIIFSDDKSNDNVKEISRQPLVTPETPKNPKKHKKNF